MSKRKSDDGPTLEEMDEEEKQSSSSSSSSSGSSGSGSGSQPAHKKQCAGAAADKPAELSAAEEGAAIERRKKISLATARLMSQLTLPGIRDCDRIGLYHISWLDVDINFASSDGQQWLPAMLLSALRKLPSDYNALGNMSCFVGTALVCEPGIDECQEDIIAALLKYEKPASQPEHTISLPTASHAALLPDVESVQPRDADHLLFLFACELIPTCHHAEMNSFVQRLIRTLILRGFDLDTRDAHGNTLLSIAAITALLTSKTECVFDMLVDQGADPRRWHSAQGHNLLRVCADHIVNRLGRLEAENRFESESPSLLDKLKRMVRLLVSYAVDTADNALTGEPYWKGLAAQTSQSLFPDDSGLTQWVAGIVLNELLVIHSKAPAAFSIRSRHVSLLPHYLAEVQSDKLMQLVEPEYPEVLGHGVPIMRLPIDIHVRDEQGRTLQQVIEQSRPAEADGPHARVRSAFLLAHLAELRRQWMEHERPFVRRQLDEQTDMPPELCDIAMAFVDGLNHKGERCVDDEQAAAPEEEDGMAGAQAAADGEQLVAGL